MKYVIQLIELTNGASDPDQGMYVMSYEPAAFAGRGDVRTTPDKGRARRFTDAVAAAEYWRQSAGIRPDGKPNRPLTAWTVEIIPAD
jgi:hypothetical protein